MPRDKDEFDRVGNMPAAWRMSAAELIAAADVLHTQRRRVDLSSIQVGDEIPPEGITGAVERMLRGYAVECLLKALWLKRGRALAEKGKLVDDAKQHDLNKLSLAVGFDTSSEESDLLARLTKYVLVLGRYPIATAHTAPGSGGSWWQSPSDDDALEALIARIRSLL